MDKVIIEFMPLSLFSFKENNLYNDIVEDYEHLEYLSLQNDKQNIKNDFYNISKDIDKACKEYKQ